MAVSVFNYLISTTPTEAENPFGVSIAPPAAAKNEIASGEAFLKVLDQVRNGKTEKSSETVFSTLTSRAESSAAAKKIGSSDNTSESVRVLKLHIKRTRASTTLAKAEEAKNKPAETQDRQKIPAADTTLQNVQAAESPTAPAQTDTAVKQADFEQKTVEQITQKPKTAEPEHDLTAADVLLLSALPVQKPVQVQETVPAAQTPEIQAPQQAVSVENDRPAEQASDLQAPETFQTAPKEKAPVQTIQKPAETGPVTEKADVKTAPVDFTPVPPEQAESVEQAPVEKASARPVETAENENPRVLEKTPVRAEQKAAETVVLKTPEKLDKIMPEQVQRAVSHMTREKDSRSGETTPQESDLAFKLPSDAKIAVHVEQTASPLLKTALPEKHKTERPLFVNQAQPETVPEERAELPLVEEKAVVKTGASVVKPQNADVSKTEMPSQPQPVLSAVPVSTNAAPAEKTAVLPTQTVSATASANTATQPAGQALFNAPNELKGKAVSASAIPQKQTPTNELVDQIKVKITKAVKDGIDKIEIVLRPKELGSIRVRLETDKDGKTNVHLTASRAETVDLLQKDVSLLKQALNDAGMNMNDGSFTFNYRGEQQQDSNASEKSASFLQEEIQDEINTTDADPASDRISGDHALNIRV